MSYVHISSEHPQLSPFSIESVDIAAPPVGCEGAWTRYVITQGSNKIVGMRAGQSAEVCSVVAHYVELLNQRFAKQKAKAVR